MLTKFISNKNGRAFKAFLALKNGEIGFEFEPRPAKAKKAGGKAGEPKAPPVKVDFSGQQSLGKCPRCASPVFETEAAYVCEKSQAERAPCKFKLSRVILQQPIDREQAAKLLSEGKSGLLTQFISKTGRPFSAYLMMDEKGKATFDFPPREEEK